MLEGYKNKEEGKAPLQLSKETKTVVLREADKIRGEVGGGRMDLIELLREKKRFDMEREERSKCQQQLSS